MLRNFIVLLLCLFSFKVGAVTGKLCLEKYKEFHATIKSNQNEYAKYERIISFITTLDQLKELVFQDQQITSKERFQDNIKYFPLPNYDLYKNFIESSHFQAFRNNKVETDRRIVEALLYEYLFGSLLCGDASSKFKPITFIYLKTHLTIPAFSFQGINHSCP